MKIPVLIVNPYGGCNCRCVMCDIWKRDRPQQIENRAFEQQLASIRELGVEWVVFSGGEPLMHAGLFEMCAMLRRENIRITILSSGLLLRRHAMRIKEYADDVIVSLDGPPEIHNEIRRIRKAFELLEAGVKALCGFPVTARSTVQRRNYAVMTQTIASAKQIGLRGISFLAADVHSDAFNRQALPEGIMLQAADVPVLEAQIDSIARSNDPFIAEPPDKLWRIVHHFRSHLGLAEPSAPQCNAPWKSAVLEADGAVRPCFFHAPVGYLNGGNLSEIVNGFEAVAFRGDLNIATNSTCRRCVCSLNWKDAARHSDHAAAEQPGR